MYAGIGLKEIGIASTIVSVIVGTLTFIVTRLIVTYKLKEKFRSKSDSLDCEKERKLAEAKILDAIQEMNEKFDDNFKSMDGRMKLGNIMIRKIVETNDKIANDEIDKTAKDLGLSLE